MKKGWFLLALLALVLSGCRRERIPEIPPPEGSSPPVEQPAGTEEPPPYVPAGTNPMTGAPIEPEEEGMRPTAVVFNNLKAAQPQLGIAKADVIYEVPAEGGITRMLALYQTLEGVGDLGSVRSARPYYIELALGHEALLVHAGGSEEAYEDLRRWKVDAFDGVHGQGQEEIFWRDEERRRAMGYEHSLLTSGEKIAAYWQEKTKYPLMRSGAGFAPVFSRETPAGAETVAGDALTVRFSKQKDTTFVYDAQQGAYLASQYGQPYLDGTDGAQVTVANVLVLETKMAVLDEEGRLRVTTTGEGEGTLYRNGCALPLRWARAERTDPFRFTTPAGAPLALAVGRSYICIIDPRNGGVSVS